MKVLVLAPGFSQNPQPASMLSQVFGQKTRPGDDIKKYGDEDLGRLFMGFNGGFKGDLVGFKMI